VPDGGVHVLDAGRFALDEIADLSLAVPGSAAS
jgi:hypothetical protein